MENSGKRQGKEQGKGGKHKKSKTFLTKKSEVLQSKRHSGGKNVTNTIMWNIPLNLQNSYTNRASIKSPLAGFFDAKKERNLKIQG